VKGLYDPISTVRASTLISIVDYQRNTASPNVIIFGETGVGKSSVVNMLTGGEGIARVSSDAKGVTFQNERYEKDIRGSRFNIFDTVGLNEGAAGTVSAPKAIEGLYRLMRSLDGGINLLVYVVRGPRIKSSIQKNYEMFYKIFCEKQVPIVLVITGLENEDDMDAWWDRNHGSFREQGMSFADAACITAIKGKRNAFVKEFEESRPKVEELISRHCSKTPWLPPAGPKASWLIAVLVKACNTFSTILPFKPIVIAKTVYEALKSFGDMGDEEARKEANEIHDRSFHC